MIIHGKYNSDMLMDLIDTVHHMQNLTSWKEKMFIGKIIYRMIVRVHMCSSHEILIADYFKRFILDLFIIIHGIIHIYIIYTPRILGSIHLCHFNSV